MPARLHGMKRQSRAVTFTAVVIAALAVASGCSSSGPAIPGSPDANAAGLFPHSFAHARLLRASAATSARHDYTFNLSGLPHQASSLVVDCAHGKISVDIGPGTNGEACHSRPTALATYCGGFPPSVTVDVSDAQDARWGAAIYTVPGSCGSKRPVDWSRSSTPRR
jgi:hypothetical protein